MADEIYDINAVKCMFDEMAKSYGIVNYISSFGFTERWRRQCIEAVTFESDAIVGMFTKAKLNPELRELFGVVPLDLLVASSFVIRGFRIKLIVI